VTASSISDVAWAATCILQVVWAWRLVSSRLHREYPVLFLYLIVTTLLSVGVFVFRQILPPWTADDSSIVPIYKFYGWFWVVSQPLLWTFSFCLIIEMYNHMIADFAGLRRLGQLMMYGASVVAALLLLTMVFADTSLATWRRFWLHQEGSFYVALTTLCLLLLSFAVFFHLSVPRNVRVLFAAFGVMFATQALLRMLISRLGEDFTQLSNYAVPIISVICLLVGVLLFSRKGEADSEAIAARRLDPRTETAMAGGLQGFNNVLVKVLRS
jgi:hypothetical protein